MSPLVETTPEPERRVAPALWRGFVGRCPHCGEGRLFRAYLKVADHCPVCGEALHHHRADDAPPYVTILIVAHVLGFILAGVLATYDDIPLWLHLIIWPALVVGLSLSLLPRIKGALIALQWALRMHGFEDEAVTIAADPAMRGSGAGRP